MVVIWEKSKDYVEELGKLNVARFTSLQHSAEYNIMCVWLETWYCFHAFVGSVSAVCMRENFKVSKQDSLRKTIIIMHPV